MTSVRMHGGSMGVSSTRIGQTVNTLAAREVDWSFDIYADILRGALKRARVTPEEVGLDSELADCLRHGGIPSPWRQSPISYRQHAHYLKLLSQT